MLHRRDFLATTTLGLCGAGAASAMGRDAEVGVAVLTHGGGWDRRPTGVEQLMWEVTKRTSIDVREKRGEISFEDPELFRWPLVVWLGEGPTPALSEKAVTRARRFLRAGGSLFIDDLSPPGDDGFDRSVRREIERIWPDRPLRRLDDDHTIYRTFFLLDKPYGRSLRQPWLEGIDFDDRSPLIYSRNDHFGAYGRDNLGQWHLPVVPGGSRQREMAFRMGVNLVMYSTCLNYKRDQVHTTAILRRRRWRVKPPRRGTRPAP